MQARFSNLVDRNFLSVVDGSVADLLGNFISYFVYGKGVGMVGL